LLVILPERANDMEDPVQAIVVTGVTAAPPHISSSAAVILPFDMGVWVEPPLTSEVRAGSIIREASDLADVALHEIAAAY
jgi:hypothetical protein